MLARSALTGICFPGNEAQIQPFTEVDAIRIANNERSADMIEPQERSLTQHVNKKHVFNVENAIGSGE
jgi:hypothetical protein